MSVYLVVEKGNENPWGIYFFEEDANQHLEELLEAFEDKRFYLIAYSIAKDY